MRVHAGVGAREQQKQSASSVRRGAGDDVQKRRIQVGRALVVDLVECITTPEVQPPSLHKQFLQRSSPLLHSPYVTGPYYVDMDGRRPDASSPACVAVR